MPIIKENISEENQKLFDWIEKNQPIFPKKYYAAQKEMIIENLEDLWTQSPDLSVKQVLVKIISPLPDFLPPENLVFLTKLITEEWEKHQKKKVA